MGMRKSAGYNSPYEEDKKMKRQEKIICNGCGKEIGTEDYLAVKKSWGYFSKKDTVIQEFDLCEECVEKMVKGFKIPVTDKEATELL